MIKVEKVNKVFKNVKVLQDVSFEIANGDYIEFYEGENLMAQVQIKIGEDVLTPIGNKVVLPEFEGNYQVGFM